MRLPIFTIQTFNQTALQPAGAIFVQRVESISVARNFLAGITGVAGGRNTMMEKKMNDLTAALMEELDLQAKKMYPNAVALVNVSLHFSDIGKNDDNMFLAGQASATALIKRNKATSSAMPSAMPSAAPSSAAPSSAAPSSAAPSSAAPSSALPSSAVPSSALPSAVPSAIPSQKPSNSIVPVQPTSSALGLAPAMPAFSGGKKKKAYTSTLRKIRKHK